MARMRGPPASIPAIPAAIPPAAIPPPPLTFILDAILLLFRLTCPLDRLLWPMGLVEIKGATPPAVRCCCWIEGETAELVRSPTAVLAATAEAGVEGEEGVVVAKAFETVPLRRLFATPSGTLAKGPPPLLCWPVPKPFILLAVTGPWADEFPWADKFPWCKEGEESAWETSRRAAIMDRP